MPNPGSVSINDVTVTEGDSGTKVEFFTVTRTGGTDAFSVNYGTADQTASVLDGDYLATSGTLSFVDGENTQTFLVTINGDTKAEFNETFFANLSAPTNGATISDGQGVGTIVNDDVAGSISINDVTITEGDSGTKVATFTVTRTGGTAPFNASYMTSNGTATLADNDYVAASGQLDFGIGVNTQTISVTINGDTKAESDETFLVTVSGANNGVTFGHNQGLGTIVNDDGPQIAGSVSVGDVSISEGSSGTKYALFTVTRTGGTAPFTVDYSTADGTASVSDHDYYAASGTLSFGDSVDTQTVWVLIQGDTKIESNETFLVNLSTPTNGATIGGAQGTGTIVDDDAPAVANARDFNADGYSDILWQNNNGQAAVWLMKGAIPLSQANAGGNPGTTMHAIDAGDFNADRHADILWQDDSGQASVWLTNGSPAVAGGNPGPAWHVVAAGDFTGDSRSDILWQNDNGQAAIWIMNGATPVVQAAVGGNPGTDWHVKAAGDFNGDGMADILWQNDNGQAAIWLMNGTTPVSEVAVGGNPGPAWHVKAAADFNGDGHADILWQNDNGQAAIWLMFGGNGITPVSEVAAGGNPGTAWHVKAAADFNGDGMADILWQNDNGQAAIWLMNGATPVSEAAVGGNPGTDWHVIA